MPTTTLTPRPDLLDTVQRWRLEQLETAGYPHDIALKLSERGDVDLHVAIGLIEDGCPLETATRILL